MPCSPHLAFMRLLHMWQQSCIDDPDYQLRHRLKDILTEANIAAVAQRDLFSEFDPEARMRRVHAQEQRQRRLIEAWRHQRPKLSLVQ
jgi:hypothetical protein